MITKIAKIRQAAGLSQVELANRLGIHVTNLNRLERGRSRPDTARLEQIARELSVSVQELFDDQPPANSSVRMIPVKGFVQAGAWAETWELADDDQYQVPIQADASLARFRLYAAETRGPSMNRRFSEGTVLIFTDMVETGEEILVGKQYVVERERADGMREATVKTLWRDDAGVFWLLPESDDPRFQQPIRVDGAEGDTIRIIGRVRYAVSRL